MKALMMRTLDNKTDRTPPSTLAVILALLLAAVAAAILPALAGLAILVTLWLRPSALDRFVRRAQLGRWVAGHGARATPAALWAARAWGIGFLLLGAIQAAGAMWFDFSVTDPKGFALRTLVALVGEVFLVLGTLVYLRRTVLSRP
jgi:hypothetical protein